MTSNADEHATNAAYAQELYLSVIERLGTQARSLSIEVTAEGVILRGQCNSYHVKQLAQEIVGKNTSRPVLQNLIVVAIE